MTTHDIETLYPLVTEAIRRAETLTSLGAPGAPTAWLDVSLLEEEISRILPTSDPEGEIARRGAVRAAVTANQPLRARELVSRFSMEPDVTHALCSELAALLPPITPSTKADDRRIFRRNARRISALSHHPLASPKAA